MQVAVYALECRGFWSAWISLDLTVDRWWRSGAGPESQGRDLVTVDKLVLLSPAVPLGWAVKLRDRFKQRDGMRNWG
ncbi:MAG TPA: DNA/RNA helicase, partial [Paenibacillus sp.]|nr:DNA/RNA helicase [Paenibacillus sp.]